MNRHDVSNDGERVDYVLPENGSNAIDWGKLDIYQQSHLHRYLYAQSRCEEGMVVGDFACGSGYGSKMLLERASSVVGGDISESAISECKNRYDGVDFRCLNLLDIDEQSAYDMIVSFETIEHFDPTDIMLVVDNFYDALKPDGTLIFSTPYRQEDSVHSRKWHRTFNIDEGVVGFILGGDRWIIESINYQNYQNHQVVPSLAHRDFIICTARKRA